MSKPNRSPKATAPLKALDDVNFQVRAGEIFGLIGADGAGKTTAFKIIAGVLAQGGGEVRGIGYDAARGRPPGGIPHAAIQPIHGPQY